MLTVGMVEIVSLSPIAQSGFGS